MVEPMFGDLRRWCSPALARAFASTIRAAELGPSSAMSATHHSTLDGELEAELASTSPSIVRGVD